MPNGSAVPVSVSVEVATSSADSTAAGLAEDLQRFVGAPATPVTYAAMNNVWYGWHQKLIQCSWTNSTASITATNSNVWVSWNAGGNGSATGPIYTNSVASVWTNWNSAIAYGSPGSMYVRSPAVQETLEQRVEREARYAEQRRVQEAEYAARLVARKEADARAEALLRAHLNPDQQEQLVREDWFLINSKSGKKYRIFRGRSANIDVLDETGKVLRSLCVHPREDVPDADTMLAQALMLRHDEESLLRLANVHPARTRPQLRLVPQAA